MAAQDVIAEIHGFSQPDSTPTPWTAGLEQLCAAETFWLSTVRPDGRPHVASLVAVWHADALWFATGAEELRPMRGLGFRKGDRFSQTTWRFGEGSD
jgi:Pyridoxamine 5'-phosphate oxidase